MTTLRLCARGLSAFLVVALVSVSAHGTVWQWSSDAPPGYEPPPYNLTEGRIEEYEGIDDADFPTISSGKHLKAIVGMEYDLTASRASGDIDKKVDPSQCAEPVFVPDELKTIEDGWPKWWQRHGEFKDEVEHGLSVTWIAPDEETTFQYPAAIALYEDDKPLSVPTGDTGSRDDESLAGYGCVQHTILIDVLKPEVVFVARVGANTTNDTSTFGTNSRGKLKLWHDNGPSENGLDWKKFCEDWENGDVVNGGATYDGDHPFSLGTGLKCEMYVKILNGDLFDEDAEDAALLPATSRQRFFTADMWRIEQQKWKKLYKNGELWKDQGCWNPDLSPGGDKDEFYEAGEPDVCFDLHCYHIYFADAPCVRPNPYWLQGEDPVQTGDVVEKQLYLRDSVQFHVRGDPPDEDPVWLTLRPFRDGYLQDWHMHNAKLEKTTGGWDIDHEAEGQSYTTGEE